MSQKIVVTIALITLISGCLKNVSNTEVKPEITDQTYVIEANNASAYDHLLTIKTSLEQEKTVVIPKTSIKKVYVKAGHGEYVKFSATNEGLSSSYRIFDSKDALIANYESIPVRDGKAMLDFIAFPPEDKDKNILKYKTGSARSFADKLIPQTYKLDERYYLENGIKTDNAYVQEACTFADEYNFIPYKGESGNFNPDILVFVTTIDEKKSPCNYGFPWITPTNGVSVVFNGNDSLVFPIWDRLAVDGPPSNMIFRKLIIDSLNAKGTLTMHREFDGKKEVFVYKPK